MLVIVLLSPSVFIKGFFLLLDMPGSWERLYVYYDTPWVFQNLLYLSEGCFCYYFIVLMLLLFTFS